MSSFSLRELAALVDGELCGDPEIEITAAVTVADIGPTTITLADDSKFINQIKEENPAAVVIPTEMQLDGIPTIRVTDVHEAFSKIVAHFRPPRLTRHVGISFHANVSQSARVGAVAEIHAGAFVDDDVQLGEGCVVHSGARILAGCKIGDGATIFPNVVLYENTVVGPRSIIHAGAVIGAYGFGYKTEDGQHQLRAQLGYVEIGADVEIGACTTIDRGTYGPTVIGDGTKIDNQVMIGHNCRIGKHNILCSQVGIAGSTTTGDYVVMAGQVGIADHVSIGERVTLGAKAGVMNDIPADDIYVGVPATQVRDQMVKQAAFAKLPELRKQFKQMQKAIKDLQQQINQSVDRDAA